MKIVCYGVARFDVQTPTTGSPFGATREGLVASFDETIMSKFVNADEGVRIAMRGRSDWGYGD